MIMHALFSRLGRLVERRPRAILFVTVVLVAMAALGASGTAIVTSQEILVSPDSTAYQEYKDYGKAFGGDPLMVLVPGTPDELTSPGTIKALRGLHETFARDASIRSVVSPVTLLDTVTLPPGATIEQPSVAKSVVYSPDGTVRQQFTSLMPAGHEIMLVRLAGGLSVDEEKAVTSRVMDAVDDANLPGKPTVAGNTRLISDITTSITKDMALTGAVAIVLMIMVLYVVFPVRRRLLALPIVLVGVLMTFGLTGAVGLSLTLVTMAGLPVLIGLGMDFAIQFHNRYEEESQAGKQPASGMITALGHVGPAVSTAVLATILGFTTLLMSAVPAVRDFGILLAIGVAVLFFVSLIALNALLYRLDHRKDTRSLSTVAEGAEPARDATQRGIPAVLTKLATGAMRFGPVTVAIAVLFAAGGFAVDSSLPVQTDIEKLVPSDTPGVRAMNDARAVLGSATAVSIMITAPDMTTSANLAWMTQFQTRVLQTHPKEIVSADSLVTVLKLNSTPMPAGASTGALAGALKAIPDDIRIGLISDDHTACSINFNTKRLSIAELDNLIKQIKREADAPSGVTIAAGGTVALGAAAVGAITDRRTTIALVGFAAVLIGLFLVYRNLRRALLPVIPIVLVTGWSSGVMWLFGLELNPLTAVMSALIIGVGTEFTVLLLERFWEELGRGASKQAAIRQAVSRVGRSITASALTVAAGFGALMASSFPALRDFAVVTVIDVLLALVATIVVVPPLAMWLTPRSKVQAEEQPAQVLVGV
jgi:hydrophobe/amphiphile efflux-3 (HAE3) family protein